MGVFNNADMKEFLVVFQCKSVWISWILS